MSEPVDRWPYPKYEAGPHDHLHALGVIAVQQASFEASVDSLYLDCAGRQSLPTELANLYYFSLAEEKRIDAIKAIFRAYEKDAAIKDLVFNLLEYFEWCRNCRNQLLHAEQYPAGFGAIPGVMHLSKRISKKSSTTGYLKLTRDELRDIADKIRAGIVQSAELNIWIRFRDVPKHKILAAYRPYLVSLPQILLVPQTLQLALHP